MNYTENYHLPQWDETDRIMRTDFNQMCADIESGIGMVEAKADEAFKPGKLPYVVGSYTGNGATLEVNVGFSPRFVIICSNSQSALSSGNVGGVLLGSRNVHSERFYVTETGFRLVYNSMYLQPAVNVNGFSYDYIAFQ